jgi:hypothetical protein
MIGRDARVKKIKHLGQFFLLYKLFLLSESRGVLTPTGTYLGATTTNGSLNFDVLSIFNHSICIYLFLVIEF